MVEDDTWLDAGVEAEDDPPALKPRHRWFEYAGVEPRDAAWAEPVRSSLASTPKDW